MKKANWIIIIFLAAFFSSQANGFAFENELNPRHFKNLSRQKITFTLDDSWFGRDKVHHFLSSAFLTTAGYYFSREEKGFSNFKSQQVGIGFSLSLGLLKEIRDGRQSYNSFSFKDMVANMLGIAVGVLIISD